MLPGVVPRNAAGTLRCMMMYDVFYCWSCKFFTVYFNLAIIIQLLTIACSQDMV